ncbi:ABC transporter ATP-binding protein [Tamaricihabitans halophyticus]|nr:ABC transporter ATP-binding protein [Tamaricihabitans halophyticus]
MTKPVIEVSDLRCAYGAFEAVRGLTFEVHKGELFALLGTNGAGKTTTLETIEGHRKPSSGAVRVLGADPVSQRSWVRQRCGIMLQESGFAGDLTVTETVQLWQGILGISSIVEDGLARLNLTHRRDVRVKQLSGGERRRLDLVLATLGQPEVVFLDEPTTGLDPQSREATWQVVRELLAGGTTVLLTTHYLEEAERLAHRLAIMHEGRFAVAGNLADVLETELAQLGFDLGDGVRVAELPALFGELDELALAEGRVQIRTARLQDDLQAVLGWAAARGVALRRLRAHHASLDDVFHRVAGGARAEISTEVTVR